MNVRDRTRRGVMTIVMVAVHLGWVPSGGAHQPVMDMAPRWNHGYGFQVRHAWHGSDRLKGGDSDVDNPGGRRQRVNTTWYEGVYTFTRAARVTVKVPWINQSRTVIRGGGQVRQADSGWGDVILAAPLKLYGNQGGATWNFGVTPSVRVPTGSTRAAFPVGDGSTDVGVSVAYSKSTPRLYQFYDLFYWANTRGSRGIAEGDQLGLDVNIGIHPYHHNATNAGMFLMWDVSARLQERGVGSSGITGGTRVSTGPILVLYRRNLMFRAEYKVPAYEYAHGVQVSFGPEVNVGIGISF